MPANCSEQSEIISRVHQALHLTPHDVPSGSAHKLLNLILQVVADIWPFQKKRHEQVCLGTWLDHWRGDRLPAHLLATTGIWECCSTRKAPRVGAGKVNRLKQGTSQCRSCLKQIFRTSEASSGSWTIPPLSYHYSFKLFPQKQWDTGRDNGSHAYPKLSRSVEVGEPQCEHSRARKALEDQRGFHKVHVHRLSYFTEKGALNPHSQCGCHWTTLTSSVIRLPNPGKTRGSKSEGTRTVPNPTHLENREGRDSKDRFCLFF